MTVWSTVFGDKLPSVSYCEAGYTNLFEMRVRHEGQWRGFYGYEKKQCYICGSLYREEDTKDGVMLNKILQIK